MNSSEKSIKSVIILEILGKPKGYVSETLNNIINQLRNEQGVSVKNSKINEPAELKENKEIFSSFAEIEIECQDLQSLVFLTFKYMPSHIEIISPMKYDINNNELSEVLTGLILRLHDYEQVARIMQSEKNILERKLKDILSKVNVSSENKVKLNMDNVLNNVQNEDNIQDKKNDNIKEKITKKKDKKGNKK